jgi:hypothetical protein
MKEGGRERERNLTWIKARVPKRTRIHKRAMDTSLVVVDISPLQPNSLV